MQLNEFQKVALQGFAAGDHAHYAEHPPSNLDRLGDTLLSFMLIELSDNEDCEDFEMAIRRLNTAIDDLAGAIVALEEADAKPVR